MGRVHNPDKTVTRIRDAATVHAGTRCQRPPRPLLMAETGVGASSASLAHVSSMAASTLDADLMVTDDDADVVACRRKLQTLHLARTGHALMLPVERRTHGQLGERLPACVAHAEHARAARGVVPEPSGRATGRDLYSGGHGHRVLSIPDQDRPYGRSRWPQPGSPRPYMKMKGPGRTRATNQPPKRHHRASKVNPS